MDQQCNTPVETHRGVLGIQLRSCSRRRCSRLDDGYARSIGCARMCEAGHRSSADRPREWRMPDHRACGGLERRGPHWTAGTPGTPWARWRGLRPEGPSTRRRRHPYVWRRRLGFQHLRNRRLPPGANGRYRSMHLGVPRRHHRHLLRPDLQPRSGPRVGSLVGRGRLSVCCSSNLQHRDGWRQRGDGHLHRGRLINLTAGHAEPPGARPSSPCASCTTGPSTEVHRSPLPLVTALRLSTEVHPDLPKSIHLPVNLAVRVTRPSGFEWTTRLRRGRHDQHDLPPHLLPRRAPVGQPPPPDFPVPTGPGPPCAGPPTSPRRSHSPMPEITVEHPTCRDRPKTFGPQTDAAGCTLACVLGENRV